MLCLKGDKIIVSRCGRGTSNRGDEKRLHSDLPTHLKPLLAGKRLLLWREILEELEYPDVAVIDDIVAGFPLTGWAPKTKVFEPRVKKPKLNVPELLRMSKGLNNAVIKSLEGAATTELDVEAWEKL